MIYSGDIWDYFVKRMPLINDPVSNSDKRYRGTETAVLFLDEGRDYFHTLLIFAALASLPPYSRHRLTDGMCVFYPLPDRSRRKLLSQ